ncbi:hypothetical protein CBER1_11780 [Cercospora berteroae]|uniref:Uncharacterized protein n=1 Tax=Cercospora berteroae TaxID=357750 RepID=A0A2S6C063_9PEZI|nr:hypothetical protein CBER1_11780 [Cercospora berteroae]
MAQIGQLPTDEVDKKWEDLYMHGQCTAIPEHQALLLPNKTEAIRGTNKYIMELDVFHQLHCLDMIRKAFYPSRYGQWEYLDDGSVDNFAVTFQHWEHCIETLRQTLMCHGDISPLRYRINVLNGILGPDLAGRHTCRNFSKILDWARSRFTPKPDCNEKVAPGWIDTHPDFEPDELLSVLIDAETNPNFNREDVV